MNRDLEDGHIVQYGRWRAEARLARRGVNPFWARREEDINSCSIGIEIVNRDGHDWSYPDFPLRQIA